MRPKEQGEAQAIEKMVLEHKKEAQHLFQQHEKVLVQEFKLGKIQLDEIRQIKLNQGKDFAQKIVRVHCRK